MVALYIFDKQGGQTNLEHDAIGSNCLGYLIFFKTVSDKLRLPREVDAVAVWVSHLAEDNQPRNRQQEKRKKIKTETATSGAHGTRPCCAIVL